MNPGNLLCLPLSRLHAVSLSNAAPTGRFAAVLRTPRYARHLTNARRTDEASRFESGDPVCRPIRLSLFRLSFHLACAANLLRGTFLYEGHSWCSRRRGTIISGRFRRRKLVGSGRYSKCYFAAFLPGPNAPRSCPFCRSCRGFRRDERARLGLNQKDFLRKK